VLEGKTKEAFWRIMQPSGGQRDISGGQHDFPEDDMTFWRTTQLSGRQCGIEMGEMTG